MLFENEESTTHTDPSVTLSDVYYNKNMELYFLSEYTQTLLDIHEDIKMRFRLNPDFLCNLDSTMFIHFLTDTIFNNVETIDIIGNKTKKLQFFYDVFTDPIECSFNLVNNFTSSFNIQLNFNSWLILCNKYSQIPKVL
jgi:hypothetical protein